MSLIKPFKGSYPQSQSFGNKLYITDPKSSLNIKGKEDFYARYNLIGHNGTDYSLPIGTQLIASIKGIVKEVYFEPKGYGWYVLIEDEDKTQGVLTAHMSRVDVQVGFSVKQGQQIGLSGNTGNSTGPHLHFGYYRLPRDRSNGYNGYINPEPYFLAIGGADMEIKDLNTWGLDDTNIDSKQIVYNAWHDVAILNKYVLSEEYNELLAHDTEMSKQVQDAKNFIEEKFKLLTQIDDMGFKTVEDVRVVRDSYLEMSRAGFASLKDITDTMSAQTEQIKNLTLIINDNAGLLEENTDLKRQVAELSIKTASVNPDSAFNLVASFLQRLVQALKIKRVTATIDIDPTAQPTPNSLELFNNYLQGK